MDYMSLLFNLGELLILDDNGLDDDDLVKWIMSMGAPSFYSIHMIKDRGNSLFKDGNFSLAISLYKLALDFLSCVAIPPSHNPSEASSLTISLVLNLTACELKLSQFIEARCLCNLILNIDPCNVKALYRRGSALKKLNLLAEALDYFEHALNLDPKNKDAARELSSVSEGLLLNTNGKRVAYHFDPLDRDKKGKKPLLNAEMDNTFVIPGVVSEACFL
ncbi:uncharacterized protein LOC141617014 [Silene latifolia]|uniref:uncharacterized protein LOC141617014 n=1 Tax=Silene latifolia TaxID=37657 RepID=UPI003D776090